ncbi:MAG: phosphatase RsbU N-terminal domain-containing protein [bacterium]
MKKSGGNNPRTSETRIAEDYLRTSAIIPSAGIRVPPISANIRYKKKKRDLLMETNRNLQETSQKLFMAKQELEKKNNELKKAREEEHNHNEQLQKELSTLKHLAGYKDIPDKRITGAMAEDLLLRYVNILESYVKTKNLELDESLAEELCRKLIECGVTPKGIISMHLKAVPQIKTIGDMETKRITFESRMVLLKVMTQYASLLKEHTDTHGYPCSKKGGNLNGR